MKKTTIKRKKSAGKLLVSLHIYESGIVKGEFGGPLGGSREASQGLVRLMLPTAKAETWKKTKIGWAFVGVMGSIVFGEKVPGRE